MPSNDDHGWLQTKTLKTRFGDFEFRGGYPVGDSVRRLLDQLTFNRAVEVYLTQLMRVSAIGLRQGTKAFGAVTPQHLIIWEDLMDAKAVVLTANAETVYGIAHLDLKADGPTVVEAAPKMLGFMHDALQRYVVDIGPLGPDKGEGGKYLVVPPGYDGPTPEGYFLARSPTYSVFLAVRGFQVDGSTAPAVALMNQTRIYALADADNPPPMQFLSGSHQPIDTLFPDTDRYFDLLAMLVDEEPAELFDPVERFQMQAVGIVKGQPFAPDDSARALLGEAARAGGAMARAITYGPPAAYFYPDRRWQSAALELGHTFERDGIPQIDARNTVYYMGAGNSPAMMDKNVGRGSQYLWTFRDASGEFLDGARTYRLHIPAGIPCDELLVGRGL